LDGHDTQRRKPALEGRSANQFELAFTKFEFLLDFGQAYNTSEGTFFHTRIIMIPSSAKALVHMLEDLIARYEAEIGVINDKGGMNGEC
jgi:hypothetical protein